jgi:integrase
LSAARVGRPVDGQVARCRRTAPTRPREGLERARPSASRLLTKRGAQQALETILADARRGRLLVPITGPAGTTFADAAREWLRYIEHDRKRRPSTVRDYRLVVDRTLIPALGDAPLEAITAVHLDEFRASLVTEDRLSARTINKYLALIHGILKRAQRVYGLTVNAAAGVERQPVRRSGDFDVLSASEVEALVRAAASPSDAAILATASYAGLRLGELRALRWRDVDFGKRLIHVRRSYVERDEGAPKSGRVRSVPMIDQVGRVLDDLSRRDLFAAEHDLVFCNESGQYFDDSALRRRFYAARGRAGIRRIRFHDLRHTFGTLAVQVFPLSDVKAYMGHADIATTMIYVHHVPRHDAASRLSAALEAAAAPPVLGEPHIV